MSLMRIVMADNSPSDFDISAHLRSKVIAELEELGLNLGPVGQISSMSLLYIMEQPLASLTSDMRQTFENITHGLNYPRTDFAFLSIADLSTHLEKTGSKLTLKEAVEAYIDILDPYAVIVLQISIQEKCGLDVRVEKPVVKLTSASDKCYLDDRPIAFVTDFFNCFTDDSLKRLAWAQMVPVSYNPAY